MRFGDEMSTLAIKSTPMGANIANNIRGPGLLFVNSKITRPDLIDEDAFFKWYDDDHIVEILETSGIRSAFRFKHVIGGDSERPFLAMYPMEDLAFTQTNEFRNINVCSAMLPHDGPVYDLADFDTRYYNLVSVHDPTNKGKGFTKRVVVDQNELGELSEDEFNRWYNEEHLGHLAGAPGYLRTTRFKLAYARSNAQSRALKGLSTTTNEPPPQPPKWLAIHEFDSEEVDLESTGQASNTEWTSKVMKRVQVAKQSVFGLVKAHGQGDWFQGAHLTAGAVDMREYSAT